MCHGLPRGPSVTLGDIPALSLLGCGEVETRKPSFGSAAGTTYLLQPDLTLLPPKKLVSLRESNFCVMGKRGVQVQSGNDLAGLLRLLGPQPFSWGSPACPGGESWDVFRQDG